MRASWVIKQEIDQTEAELAKLEEQLLELRDFFTAVGKLEEPTSSIQSKLDEILKDQVKRAISGTKGETIASKVEGAVESYDSAIEELKNVKEHILSDEKILIKECIEIRDIITQLNREYKMALAEEAEEREIREKANKNRRNYKN